MSVAKAGRTLQNFIVTHVCLPFIHRFLTSLLGCSAETLTVAVPCISKVIQYGNKESNNNDSSETVTMIIEDPLRMSWRMLLDSKMGLGEAYMWGYWRATPDPTHLLNLFIRAKKQSKASNKGKLPSSSKKLQKIVVENMVNLIRHIAAVVNYIAHRLRDNSLSNSKKNIEEHYDLGNDMFELFLDPSMTYSCAVFEDEDKFYPKHDGKILQAAQMRKIDDLLDRLNLSENDHVLEIGCGWGAAAIRAVQKYNCRWTGITLSDEQLAWAQDKVKEAGLEDKIQLLIKDYRLVEGTYSKVISIEMIEAVGQQYLKTYFEVISKKLQPGGTASLQAIICPDSYYERYCKSADFIKKYIFPGGHMPSMGAIEASLPKDLSICDEKFIGLHYAKTLDMWFSAWMNRQKELRELGLSETFHRKWQFYFSMCSALFTNRHIDTVQFTLKKQL